MSALPQPSAGTALDLQRHLLLVTTAVAVVSDAMLIPFYPNLFAESFGVTDPRMVGTYLAATCLVAMIALPGWAWLEKYVPTLVILLFSQLAAGLCSLGCFAVSELWQFWLVALLMIVFKASYLLVYPYLLRLEDKSQHARTIGLLTVIVHLGGIAGATFGGWVLQRFSPQHAFVGMAMGDFMQMLACVILVICGARPPVVVGEVAGVSPEPKMARRIRLAKLGSVMMLFYFGVFVIRPFFVAYWGTRSAFDGELISGWVFSIPAWMALACLAYQHRSGTSSPPILRSLAIAVVGLGLQMVPAPAAIIVGRCIFGWCAFRAMVQLDLLIFEKSPPESYAADFSRMNICQQLGVLVAFYGAGYVVAAGGLVIPFVVACGGLGLTAFAYQRFFVHRGEAQEALVPS